MKKFITLSKIERKNLIQKASFDLGMRFDVVEKDIWVCYVLEKLFLAKELQGTLTFKGGTSLSKAYGLIERFSEDVDLIINRSCLKIEGESKKNKKVGSRIRKATRSFVRDKIYGLLQESFAKDLGAMEDSNWRLDFDKKNDKEGKEIEDETTLLFYFPVSPGIFPPYSIPFTPNNYYNYIKPSIKLEFVALGEDFPVEEKTVEPYAKKILPNFFDEAKIRVLDAKRTFIEKLLILHSICLRPTEKPILGHYSRHYYDIFCLIKSGIGAEATKFPKILKSVKENKATFFEETWVDYGQINSFSDIELVPTGERLKEVENDYKKMKEMFFEKSPDFLEIIAELKNFEKFLGS